MAKTTETKVTKKRRSAMTDEARENQLIALATNLAEEQLRAGTASSQVITHYLKLGSLKGRAEREILEQQKLLIEAKTESLKAVKENRELILEAVKAMQMYSDEESHENV